MAVLKVTQLADSQAVRDYNGIKQTLNYQVITDSATDLAAICLTAVDPVTSLSIPDNLTGLTISIPIESGGYVTATLRDVSPAWETQTAAGGNVFKVKCTYDSNINWQQSPSESEPWEIEFRSESQEIVQDAYQDKDGNKITNSAGQPFDPSLMETIYDEEISIGFKTYSAPWSAIQSCLGKTNSGGCSFTILGISRSFSDNCLKLTEGNYEPYYGQGVTAWKVSLKFHHRPDTYTRHVLDAGFYQLVSGQLKIINDSSGNPVNAPAYLDGSGAVSTSAHFLDFNIEEQTDFSGLFTGIPS
jgi:hypothetical protein